MNSFLRTGARCVWYNGDVKCAIASRRVPCFKGKGIVLPQLCMHIRPSKFGLFFVTLYRQSASALPLYRSSCSPKSGLAQLYKHCLVWLLAEALRCVAIALSIALTSSVHAVLS